MKTGNTGSPDTQTGMTGKRAGHKMAKHTDRKEIILAGKKPEDQTLGKACHQEGETGRQTGHRIT